MQTYFRMSRKSPYARSAPMTVKVISMRTTKRVGQWSISKSVATAVSSYSNTVAAVSDGKDAFNFVVYEKLASEMVEGASYILKNYGMSDFAATLLTRNNTELYLCGEVEVPEALAERARAQLSPPSPSTLILDLHGELQNLVTVEGKVSSLDDIKPFSSNNGWDVPVRSIILKDNEAEVKIVLWRESNLTVLTLGMLLKVTHLKVKGNPFSLRTTKNSEVEPLTVQKTVVFKGFRALADGNVALLDQDFDKIVIPAQVWERTFPGPVPMDQKVTICYVKGVVEEINLK